MKIRDVLRSKERRLFVMGPEATVLEAVRCLVEHNIGSMPVVDKAGFPIGIFSERDALRGFAGECEAFAARAIDEVMTPDPICCGIDDEIGSAMGLLSRHGIGQLPVLDDNGRVVGVVSVGDLVKILHEHEADEKVHLLAYIQGAH